MPSVALGVAAVVSGAAALSCLRSRHLVRGTSDLIAWLGIVVFVIATLLRVSWPSLVPPGRGPDLTHHLLLVDYIEQNRHLVHDRSLDGAMGEMAHYTPGAHLLAVIAGACVRRRRVARVLSDGGVVRRADRRVRVPDRRRHGLSCRTRSSARGPAVAAGAVFLRRLHARFVSRADRLDVVCGGDVVGAGELGRPSGVCSTRRSSRCSWSRCSCRGRSGSARCCWCFSRWCCEPTCRSASARSTWRSCWSRFSPSRCCIPGIDGDGW